MDGSFPQNLQVKCKMDKNWHQPSQASFQISWPEISGVRHEEGSMLVLEQLQIKQLK